MCTPRHRLSRTRAVVAPGTTRARICRILFRKPRSLGSDTAATVLRRLRRTQRNSYHKRTYRFLEDLLHKTFEQQFNRSSRCYTRIHLETGSIVLVSAKAALCVNRAKASFPTPGDHTYHLDLAGIGAELGSAAAPYTKVILSYIGTG